MTVAIKKEYVKVGTRWVHYRRSGRGPVIVLLHGSPNSSLSLEPLINILSRQFTCFAFDTPGNGNSSPLTADEPSSFDYASALKETLDTLKLDRVALHGFHTGAGIAAEFINHWPERVSCGLFDGVAAWTEEEKSGMLQGYLVPFEPKWDGSHLTSLWARMMEQGIFFPWHHPSQEYRMNYDMSSPEIIHQTTMEFLRAGDHYRKPYAAALAGDGAKRVKKLSVPCFITAHPLDPIAHHLDRLLEVPANVEIYKNSTYDQTEIYHLFLDWYKKYPADPPSDYQFSSSGLQKGYIETPNGLIFWHGTVEGKERPLLLFHDAGGSSLLFERALAGICPARPVITFDLPGHGESEVSNQPCSTVNAFAEELISAFVSLGLKNAAGIGFHLGGQVATELKHRNQLYDAAMIGALHFTKEETQERLKHYAPDLTIRWDGGHLLTAWHFVRLRTLYNPWYKRDRHHIHWSKTHLNTRTVHRQTIDLFKTNNLHRLAYAAQFTYPTAERARQANIKKLYTVPFDSMGGGTHVRTLGDAANVVFDTETLQNDPAQWAIPFQKFAIT